MTEEQENVAAEIQQEEVVSPQDSLPAESHDSEETSEAQEKSDKEQNFSRLRESKEQLERENKELREVVMRGLKQESSSAPPKEEDDLGIDDEDIVEGRLVKKLYKKLREVESRYERDKLATIPDRLRGKFSDFDQVVTQENVEKLKLAEPELYASITSGNDLYAKGVSAYKTLRAMGIAKDDPYVAQKEHVQQNHLRPMSAQAVKGQGALSEANIFAKGLTPELKKQLQQEMQEAAKAR